MKANNSDNVTFKKRDFLAILIENYAVWIIFIFTVILLLLALKFSEEHYIIIFPIIIFLINDIIFRRSNKGKWRLYGRNYKSTLHGIRAAIQYTTFLFGFIGIVLSSSFDLGILTSLLEFFFESKWLQFYLISISMIITLMLLFIPVVYSKPQNKEDKEGEEPSQALKNYYFIILFLQKTIILLTMYLLLLALQNYICNFVVN
jgi:hypothetical protein